MQCPLSDIRSSDMVTAFPLFSLKPLVMLTAVGEIATIIFNGNPLEYIFVLLILLHSCVYVCGGRIYL